MEVVTLSRMRFVALVSGGKDSIYSALECIKNGHELIACVHLGAPESTDEESYMYQTAASEVVRTLVEDCLEVPLLLYQRVGKSINTSMVYQNDDSSSERDEVEDLFLALQQAKEKYNVQAVSSGAILSTYQRVRIEHVCSRLGLTSLSYLWRLLPQKELLQRMLEDGIVAVIVRAACPPGLVPRKHLNKTLKFLWDCGLLERLHQRYQFHVCGEGGEYESLVVDSPLHKKKLVFDEVFVDETDDGVGVLSIPKCHAAEKGEDDIPILEYSNSIEKETRTVTKTESSDPGVRTEFPRTLTLPHIRQGTGGLLHTSEIMASIAASSQIGKVTEADLAVEEAVEVFSLLKTALETHQATPQDVMFVHLYLSEISHFATINAHYQKFFGILLPPSRSCVAVGSGVLPGGRRVLLDCMIQIGSGEYIRSSGSTSNPYTIAAHATTTSRLRDVLHVQSISHWAPVCVGPYSQVNTLRSGLHFLAGQIGLIPCTMNLHPTWELQLEQCWQNIASVLDALNGGSLKHLFSGLIYVSREVFYQKDAIDKIVSISNSQIKSNGSIVPGKVDSLLNQSNMYGGYEDEGTWEEMKGEQEDSTISCPLLVVSLPEMPKGAVAEVEVISVTEGVASSLEVRDAEFQRDCKNQAEVTSAVDWDTGNSFPETLEEYNESIQIHSMARVVGHRCAGSVLITASTKYPTMSMQVQLDSVLNDMFLSMDTSLAEARSGLCPLNVFHIRLFYVATEYSRTGDVVAKDDGLRLRASLHSAIGCWYKGQDLFPASSVVPVHGLTVINAPFAPHKSIPFLAMQVSVLDPVQMATEVFIHKDREYR